MMDFMKTILNAILTRIPKKLSDLNNDIFYDTTKLTPIVKKRVISIPEEELYVDLTDYAVAPMQYEEKIKYLIIVNGVKYECITWWSDDWKCYILGDGSAGDTPNIGGKGEPFLIDIYDDGYFYFNVAHGGDDYTIEIYLIEDDVKPLEERFIPDSIARKSDLEELGVDVPTKLSDLENDIFYDGRFEVLVPKQTFNFVKGGADSTHWNLGNVGTILIDNANSDTPINLGRDQVFSIIFDGVEYECESQNGEDYYYLGSFKILDGDYSEEPFFILKEMGNEKNWGMWVAPDNAGEHTVEVRIKTREEGLVPINEKYIPDSIKLPKVTSADNGKILRVVDGKWTCVDLN